MKTRRCLLSALVAWRNRETLQQSLKALVAACDGLQFEVIVANCGGSRRQLRRLLAAEALRDVRVINLTSRAFNKSLALNVAAFSARGEILMVVDADIIFEQRAVYALVQRLESGAFINIAQVRETVPPDLKSQWIVARRFEMHLEMQDDRTVVIPLNRFDYKQGAVRGCGLIMAWRADLLAIGGYNSSLRGWGWEDNDLVARLKLALRLRQVWLGRCVHLSHPDALRALHGLSKVESEELNLQRCLRRYERGEFHGTMQEDVQRSMRPRLQSQARRPAVAANAVVETKHVKRRA